MKKPVQGGFSHGDGGQQDEDGNQKSADIFHASVAVRVSAVFFPCRQGEACYG